MPNHLIANSGIQFICNELQFNPSEAPLVENEKSFAYYFLLKQYSDPVTDTQEISYDFLCKCGQEYVPLNDLVHDDMGLPPVEILPSGRIRYFESGLPSVLPGSNLNLYSTLRDGDPALLKISSLDAMYTSAALSSSDTVPVYEKFIDKWIPVPMFEVDEDGVSSSKPKSWCRIKLQSLEKSKKIETYRAIWAFDTDLGDVLDDQRPVFELGGNSTQKFSICNNALNLITFLYSSNFEEAQFTPEAEYILGLLDIAPEDPILEKLKYLSYYLYFLTYLRLSGNMEVELHFRPEKVVDVDMVLDIGNSRTCGVVFENGDFAMGKMLNIRDLSEPWRTYQDSFDMRIAFRKADFGSDICCEDKSLFRWNSIVRVGEEAKNLMYASREDEGIAERTTNYSSPKRYLWDHKPFFGQWDILIKDTDPLNVRAASSVYLPGFSDWFDSLGRYDGSSHSGQGGPKYSRSSLMTFAFVEIFQQAYMYINSPEYRSHCGSVDFRRKLRNIIITAPTAMPSSEQIILRQSARDALSVLGKMRDYWTGINVAPNLAGGDWCYDEATSSQFVYLYAEVMQKYNQEIGRFIDTKGHFRPEDGENEKSLTLASIDIGAGTTDLMICSYKKDNKGPSRIKPVPIFWDSFYLAGDDIIKQIIKQFIIDGSVDSSSDNVGTLTSILNRRLLSMTNEQISRMPVVNKTNAFRQLLNNVLSASSETRKKEIKVLTSNIVANYFGVNAAGMSYKDKICRLDFNTQISVPLAQFYLEQLRNRRPARLYRYDEIFTVNKPAEYLLRHFENHFGFRFEDLEWRYEPVELAKAVGKTVEPLMKQLSVILYAYKIDTLILAGRPASLDAVTDLFIKYYPVSPDRLVRLNQYHVGRWYPLATDNGYFVDQKSVVAVGAMVANLASSGFNGLTVDMSDFSKMMHSTANYVGVYNPDNFKISSAILEPTVNRARLRVDSFPIFLGCKQLNVREYHARPFYAIENHSGRLPLILTLSRDYRENRENIVIEEVFDEHHETIPLSTIEMTPQSLAVVTSGPGGREQTVFWMDDGAFKFLDA